MSHVAYACRSTGGFCEWALEADSPEVILHRVAEHQKCAHHVPELSLDFRQKVAAAIRTA
jgi:predicted small metal-binding protein